MQLKLLDQNSYMIVKFPVETALPEQFSEISAFKSVTYTAEECSIIVPEQSINTDLALSVDNDWFIIQIVGELDFSLVGILTKLANPLAENQISIFALSTYNTDYLLMKNKDKNRALTVLTSEGHDFVV